MTIWLYNYIYPGYNKQNNNGLAFKPQKVCARDINPISRLSRLLKKEVKLSLAVPPLLPQTPLTTYAHSFFWNYYGRMISY